MGMLYLVRHGESTAQIENKIGGQASFPLSMGGLEQAYTVAEKLNDINIDFIYCSKVQRAIDTTNIIINKINKPSNTFIIGHNMLFADWLNERTHGVWDGLSQHEMNELFTTEVQDTWYQTIHSKSPGGESLDDVYDRVVPEFYDKIYKRLQHSNETILIVSHKRVMQALISFIYKNPKENMPNIDVKNATIYNYLIK